MNFKGGFNGGNLQNLMRQAQKMQEQMENAKAELVTKEFVGTSGGNMVSVTVNGDKKVLKVALNPAVVDVDDVEMLEDLIVSATNDALEQVKAEEAKSMPQMPAGF